MAYPAIPDDEIARLFGVVRTSDLALRKENAMDAETMPGSTTCNEEEWALRQDTAAAFRLLDRYGMSDLTNGSVV